MRQLILYWLDTQYGMGVHRLETDDRIERMLGKGGIYVIRKFFGIILLAISARLFTANITSLIEQFQALK